MVLPYDITEPRDVLVSVLSEEWLSNPLPFSTLCEIIINFDRGMRELKRRNL